MSHKPMLILIAGPYRSGTGDDPEKMAGNLQAWKRRHALFQKGHVPMIGEWVALPIWHVAGGSERRRCALRARFSSRPPHRLLQLCEAVLRLPGNSKGADNDVRIAGERGIPVYFDISEIPVAA